MIWKHTQAQQQIELAIFFGDLVYQPTAKDNELQSAILFKSFSEELQASAIQTELGQGQLSADSVQLVYEWIVRTATTHTTTGPATGALAIVLDIDLAVLGRTPHAHYARVRFPKLARRESAHVCFRKCTKNSVVHACILVRSTLRPFGRSTATCPTRTLARGGLRFWKASSASTAPLLLTGPVLLLLLLLHYRSLCTSQSVARRYSRQAHGRILRLR